MSFHRSNKPPRAIDMLVMGAYGHARLQKMVLGGVPREMLRTDDGTDADVALT